MTEEQFIKACAEETIKKIPTDIIPNKLKKAYTIRLTKDERFKKKCLDKYYEIKLWNQQVTID